MLLHRFFSLGFQSELLLTFTFISLPLEELSMKIKNSRSVVHCLNLELNV